MLTHTEQEQIHLQGYLYILMSIACILSIYWIWDSQWLLQFASVLLLFASLICAFRSWILFTILQDSLEGSTFTSSSQLPLIPPIRFQQLGYLLLWMVVITTFLLINHTLASWVSVTVKELFSQYPGFDTTAEFTAITTGSYYIVFCLPLLLSTHTILRSFSTYFPRPTTATDPNG